MSNEKKDGGPAFPTMDTWWTAEDGATYTGHSEGLTIRDYFAATAMQAYLSNPQTMAGIAEMAEGDGISSGDFLAGAAYASADAMLKAREE